LPRSRSEKTALSKEEWGKFDDSSLRKKHGLAADLISRDCTQIYPHLRWSNAGFPTGFPQESANNENAIAQSMRVL
jgi:hypothetical protein